MLFRSLAFQERGHRIYLIGESQNDISSSEYLYSYHKIKNSPAPYFDLEKEYQLQRAVRKLIQKGLIQSAHDCADGGLFITLLESAMVNNLGFDISCDEDFRKDAFLFGEAQSRVVVSVKDTDEDAFIDFMSITSVEFSYIGDVIENEIIVDEESFGNIAEAKSTFDSVLANALQ